jgi:hypothetical protein
MGTEPSVGIGMIIVAYGQTFSNVKESHTARNEEFMLCY